MSRNWTDVMGRTLQILVAAFATLMVKEWLETNEWDAPACAVDSAWIAGGSFVVNAVLTLVYGQSRD